MSQEPPFQPYELLEQLSRADVDFVVIGGMASILKGGALLTFDLDIMYRRSRENFERLAAALRSLDVRWRTTEAVPIRIDAATLRNGDRFTFKSKFGDFDCLATADGAASYDEIKGRAELQDLGGFAVYVASIDDLIIMKRAVHRPKDMARLLELEELKKLEEEEARGRHST